MFVPCTDPSTVWEEYQAGLLWERVGNEYYPAAGWSKAGIEWYIQVLNPRWGLDPIAIPRIYKCFED